MNQQKNSARSLTTALCGRSFVHPVFDYLLIGGGLSLIVTVIVFCNPDRLDIIDRSMFPYLILFSNSAHFASSTVRLYTKPGASQALPFLTSVFPIVMLVALLGCLYLAGSVGPYLQALYLTWSPYHYTAQAYGLALVYAYRSGCTILPADKKLLWWASLLPFFYAFLGDQGSGLHWLLPADAFSQPHFRVLYSILIQALPMAALAAAVVVLFRISSSGSGPLPIISVLMLVSNAVWWCILPQKAFVWATIFHGLQYLSIVSIFHVKDQLALPNNRHSWWYHLATFYAMSLLLGYSLFSCLPWGFAFAGFGLVESIILVVAAINIHHFIVDAYIWRLKSGDRNRQIVESGASLAV